MTELSDIGVNNLGVQAVWSALTIMITTIVYGLVVALGSFVLRPLIGSTESLTSFLREFIIIVLFSTWLILGHAASIAIWAGLFLHKGLFEAWEPAVYFAAVAYTTLGFGDVLLADEWRLLSGAAAANGLLLFGLSSAVLFDVASRLRVAGLR